MFETNYMIWIAYLLFVIIVITANYFILKRIMNRQKAPLPNETSLLQQFIDNIPDTVYFKDRSMCFTQINKAQAKLLGLENPSDAIGKSDANYFGEAHAKITFDYENKIIETGEKIISKEEKLFVDGKILWVTTTKIPIKNNNGKIIGTAGLSRNITKQKLDKQKLREANNHLKEQYEEINQRNEEIKIISDQLENSNKELEKFSIVAKNTDNAIIITDKHGVIEWINDGYLRMYGFVLNELKSKRGRLLTDIYDNEKEKRMFYLCEERKKSVIYESSSLDEKNKIIWGHTTLTPIISESGNIINFVAVISDISQMKEVKMELFQQKEEIEAQRDELQKLNITKDKFFSIIAHDLKNPFNSLINYSHILLKDFTKLDDITKIEYLEVINSSSVSTFNLLENLLQWSRSQTQGFNKKQQCIDIKSLIDDNLNLLRPSAHEKNIKLISKIDDVITVYIDKNMINTVIRNLITNAIKFTNKNGIVTIGSKKLLNEIELSVSDTGIGITEETIKKLFVFEHNYTTLGTMKEKGTGLGLLLCKEFVEANNGKIRVKSEQRNGSTFYFTMPMCENSINASASLITKQNHKDKNKDKDIAIEQNWKNNTILIAEDEILNYKLLNHILQKTGINILWAKNGNEAVDLFIEYKNGIDIVLVDINLPGQNGYLVIQKIKHINTNMPIIVQSGISSPEEKQQALDAGCDGFIDKPYNSNNAILELLKWIKK